MRCNACRNSFTVSQLAKIGKYYYCFDCCMADLQRWELEA